MTRLLVIVAACFINEHLFLSATFAIDRDAGAFSSSAASDPFRNKFLVFAGESETVHEDVRLHLLGGEAFLVLRPAQFSKAGQLAPVHQQWLRLSSNSRFYLFETRADAERFVSPSVEKLKKLNHEIEEPSWNTFPHPEQMPDPLDSKGIMMYSAHVPLTRAPLTRQEFDVHAVGREYFLSLKTTGEVGRTNWLPFHSVDRIITFSSDEDARAFERMLHPEMREVLEQHAVPTEK